MPEETPPISDTEHPHSEKPIRQAQDTPVRQAQDAWYTPLARVTPLSKALAMGLFILLPFAGFVVGVGYSSNKSSHEVQYMHGTTTEQSAQKRTGRLRDCDILAYKDSIDQCYFQYAQSRNDINLCQFIENRDYRVQCVEYVVPAYEQVELYTLGAYPGSVALGTQQDVIFTISHAGIIEHAQVRLVEVDDKGREVRTLGVLKDEGEGEDVSVGDYLYTGNFMIGPYDTEQTVLFQAKVSWDNAGIATSSETLQLLVTSFPQDTSKFDESKVVIDPVTGESFVGNQVLIGFTSGTSPERIREIVSVINGEVIGGMYDIGVYQVRIEYTVDGSGVLDAIEKLITFEEVEYAEKNGITHIDG